MKVVIVEDEVLAIEKLERYLLKYDVAIQIMAKLGSITEAVQWFENKENQYDLIFMDIQLIDGLSFEIFNKVQIKKPIIFTTAFDEYAVDAFKVNSIDYLLKPVTFTDLSKALEKLKTLKTVFTDEKSFSNTLKIILKKNVKERFLVRLGNHIHSIKTNDISLFYADGRTVFLVTNQNKKFIVDYRLEDLIDLLPQADFFRVNRTFIVNINAIIDVIIYTNSRLKIKSKVLVDKEIIVSREKVIAFKRWFSGERIIKNNYDK